jgi:mono/diheme cytochrome c family protein
MGRLWRPVAIGGAVVVATFALARAQVFAPSAPEGGVAGAGDAYDGETIFQRQCAGCHGDEGKGGGVGPALFETGLSARDVAIVVQQGRGVMPAQIVAGEELADVTAYVESISSPGQ